MRLLDHALEVRELAVAVEGDVIDNDGCVLTQEEIAEIFAGKELAFETKLESCVRVLRGLEAAADAIKVEEERLAKRRLARSRNADSLRAYIRSCMKTAELRKVETATHTVTLTAPKERVVVDDVNRLPSGCYREERVADKKAIRSALDKGPVPGAHIELGEDVLSIR